LNGNRRAPGGRAGSVNRSSPATAEDPRRPLQGRESRAHFQARARQRYLDARARRPARTSCCRSRPEIAPLETLLDAAALTVYYSGGEKWGKTEVDYTFKKYVKRIRDSTEASYTGNKTLVVEPDPARIQALARAAGALVW